MTVTLGSAVDGSGMRPACLESMAGAPAHAPCMLPTAQGWFVLQRFELMLTINCSYMI